MEATVRNVKVKDTDIFENPRFISITLIDEKGSEIKIFLNERDTDETSMYKKLYQLGHNIKYATLRPEGIF